MTMTTETTDWEKVQSIIDAMRHQDESELSLEDQISEHMNTMDQYIDAGWPYQEIVLADSDEPIGIPVELAYSVISIFKFCAEKNIDLAYAMEQITTGG